MGLSRWRLRPVSSDLFEKNIYSNLAKILKGHGAKARNDSDKHIVEYPLTCFGYLVGLCSEFRGIGA